MDHAAISAKAPLLGICCCDDALAAELAVQLRAQSGYACYSLRDFIGAMLGRTIPAAKGPALGTNGDVFDDLLLLVIDAKGGADRSKERLAREMFSHLTGYDYEAREIGRAHV